VISALREDLRAKAVLGGIDIRHLQGPPDGFDIRSAELGHVRRFQIVLKEPLINSAAHLAVPFPPCISCRFFDLPPVNLQNLQECLTENSLAS